MKNAQYKKYIRLGFTFVCICYLIYFLVNHKSELNIFLNIKPHILFFLFLAAVFTQLWTGFRMKIVLEKCSGRRLPLISWLRIFITGRILSTLFSQTGNIYRSYALKKQFNVSYTNYITTLTSFMWMDICISILFGIFAAIIVKSDSGSNSIAGHLLIVFTVIFTGPILSELLFRRIKLPGHFFSWLHAKFAELLKTSVSNLKDFNYILKIVTTSLLSMFFSATIMFYYFKMLDIELTILQVILFFIIWKLCSVIVITPGNIGIRELFYGLISEKMGIGMTEGISVSILIRVVGTASLFLIAPLFSGFHFIKNAKKIDPDLPGKSVQKSRNLLI